MEWNKELVTFFNEQDFRQCLTDPCMFIKRNTKPGEYLAIPILVDDMVPTGKPQSLIQQFMDWGPDSRSRDWDLLSGFLAYSSSVMQITPI